MKTAALLLASLMAAAAAGNAQTIHGWRVADPQAQASRSNDLRQVVLIGRKPVTSRLQRELGASQQLNQADTGGWSETFAVKTGGNGNGNNHRSQDAGSAASSAANLQKSGKWKYPGDASHWRTSSGSGSDAVSAVNSNQGNGYYGHKPSQSNSASSSGWQTSGAPTEGPTREPLRSNAGSSGRTTLSRQALRGAGGWHFQAGGNSQIHDAFSGNNEHVYTIKTVSLDSSSPAHSDGPYFSGFGPMSGHQNGGHQNGGHQNGGHQNGGAAKEVKEIYVVKTLSPDPFIGTQMSQDWASIGWEDPFGTQQGHFQINSGWNAAPVSADKHVFVIKTIPGAVQQQQQRQPFGWPSRMLKSLRRNPWS